MEENLEGNLPLPEIPTGILPTDVYEMFQSIYEALLFYSNGILTYNAIVLLIVLFSYFKFVHFDIQSPQKTEKTKKIWVTTYAGLGGVKMLILLLESIGNRYALVEGWKWLNSTDPPDFANAIETVKWLFKSAMQAINYYFKYKSIYYLFVMLITISYYFYKIHWQIRDPDEKKTEAVKNFWEINFTGESIGSILYSFVTKYVQYKLSGRLFKLFGNLMYVQGSEGSDLVNKGALMTSD